MVRTIKARTGRAPAKGERALLLPGATGAEPWEAWIIHERGAECLRTCARPGENPWRRASTLALPVAEVLCLPLWLNETDPKRIAGMIPLQLEMRGLQPRGQQAVFDFTVIEEENARTLVTIGILPAALSNEIESAGHSAFDLSARYFPLAENAVTFWRERDRLVAAITRGKQLVYFQALGGDRIGASLLQDLRCIVAGLEMQGVLAPLRQVILWTETTSVERESLQETLRLPVQQEDRPHPRAPEAPWKLVPVTVAQARLDRISRRWRVRGIFVGLALYLAFVGGMIAQLVISSNQAAELQKWMAQHADALALVHDTRAVWNDLRPVVDQQNYPLELLLRISRAIPADQLHLTLFEASDGHLLIKGEAKNVSAAFQFLERLKKDPAFAGDAWVMGQPHLLPNDLAQFQIEGTLHSGDPQ